MRILIFHGYLLRGTGSNIYNANLARELAGLGHEVHLFCQDRTALPPKGVPIHVWKHKCKDGPVTCIGQLSERLPGLRWVVVMRVGLYG